MTTNVLSQEAIDTTCRSSSNLVDQKNTRQVLDELFSLTRRYRSAKEYGELLSFIRRFRQYSPYNAVLVNIQMPGARFVASARRWRRKYHHQIKPGAHPLLMLQPMGPVMFAFDVSDTEPLPGAPPLPREVISPFEVRGGKIGDQPGKTIENAKRDGIRITRQNAGSQHAGQIGTASTSAYLEFVVGAGPSREVVSVPVRYELLLSDRLSAEASYATLVHELAHLYCGHLGTPNVSWWPDRRTLSKANSEFEAESVCYLVCGRAGIDNPSEEYLACYLQDHEQIPEISLESVIEAVSLIERMGSERLKLRRGSPRSKPTASSESN